MGRSSEVTAGERINSPATAARAAALPVIQAVISAEVLKRTLRESPSHRPLYRQFLISRPRWRARRSAAPAHFMGRLISWCDGSIATQCSATPRRTTECVGGFYDGLASPPVLRVRPPRWASSSGCRVVRVESARVVYDLS